MNELSQRTLLSRSRTQAEGFNPRPRHRGHRFLASAAPLLLLLATLVSASTPQTILFRNGDLLAGQLESITPTNGLRWRHADAAAAIQFQPGALAEVHLGAQSPPPVTSPSYCYVRLTNGDELAGNLKSLDEQELVLETWFAGTLTLPRSRVASVRPAGPTPRAVFAGPDGLEGWTMGKELPGNVNAGQWHFVNGAFVSSQPASIARDVKLPLSSSLEFDLSWRGQFSLAIALYTDSLQPVRLAQTADEPAFGSFYSLQLTSFSTQLLHVRHKDQPRPLGLAVIPLLQQTNQARIAIKTSREQKTISLLLNGVLTKQWVDPDGFGGEGTGIRLVQQGLGPVRFTNLRITEWDGRLEETVAPLVPNQKNDVARLVNRDSVAGRWMEFKDGKLRFLVEDNSIEIPLDRVGQVDFATDRSQSAPLQVGDIRVFFAGRGSLTLTLESWTEQAVHATNANFGKAQFMPRAFSRIVFQPQP